MLVVVAGGGGGYIKGGGGGGGELNDGSKGEEVCSLVGFDDYSVVCNVNVTHSAVCINTEWSINSR